MDMYQAASMITIVIAILVWKVFKRWSELEELKIRNGMDATCHQED